MTEHVSAADRLRQLQTLRAQASNDPHVIYVEYKATRRFIEACFAMQWADLLAAVRAEVWAEAIEIAKAEYSIEGIAQRIVEQLELARDEASGAREGTG